MKYLTILMLLPTLLSAQDYQFQREWDSVQVEIGNYPLPAAWTGGYTRTCPDFCDIDADGDLDAFIGSFNGRLEFWENQGSAAQYQFILADPAFQDLDSLQATWPEFWDMDADGDLDLFLYNYIWGFQVYENIGSTTTPNLTLIDSSLSDIEGNPIWGADPALVDIDSDGDKDLFIGTFTYGHLKYYENVGDSTQYAFSLVTSNYFGIATGEWCSSEFCDIDADGDYDLFIGDWYGRIWYYRNDGTPQQAQYVLVSSYWLSIDVGNYAIPEFADMDGDGDYDLWVGRDVEGPGSENTPGDVLYYENTGTPQSAQYQLIRLNNLTLDAGHDCGPELVDDDNDGDLDLWYSNGNLLVVQRNVGNSTSPQFVLENDNVLNGVNPYGIDFYDLDSDGDQDLISSSGGFASGTIRFYQNVGVPGPEFVEWFEIPVNYELSGNACIADLDDDGDGDMVLGRYFGNLVYYENQGTAQHPAFILQSENWQNIWGWAIWLADMDGDFDFDLLVVNPVSGTIWLYENIGSPQYAQLALADTNLYGSSLIAAAPCTGDLDNDGDVDLLDGSADGGLRFLRNITGEIPGVRPGRQATAPYRGPVLSIGPNPANPLTIISCQLPAASNLSLEIFDISGKKVMELASGLHLPGEYRYVWDAGKNASGIYVIRLRTPQFNTSQKLTIVK